MYGYRPTYYEFVKACWIHSYTRLRYFEYKEVYKKQLKELYYGEVQKKEKETMD